MAANFLLDTKPFTDAAKSAENLAKELECAISETDRAVNALYGVWAGKGRNAFEKKYKIFEGQVVDIRDGLWDLYEDIVAAEEGYIQADTDAAKKAPGMPEGGITLDQYE